MSYEASSKLVPQLRVQRVYTPSLVLTASLCVLVVEGMGYKKSSEVRGSRWNVTELKEQERSSTQCTRNETHTSTIWSRRASGYTHSPSHSVHCSFVLSSPHRSARRTAPVPIGLQPQGPTPPVRPAHSYHKSGEYLLDHRILLLYLSCHSPTSSLPWRLLVFLPSSFFVRHRPQLRLETIDAGSRDRLGRASELTAK